MHFNVTLLKGFVYNLIIILWKTRVTTILASQKSCIAILYKDFMERS